MMYGRAEAARQNTRQAKQHRANYPSKKKTVRKEKIVTCLFTLWAIVRDLRHSTGPSVFSFVFNDPSTKTEFPNREFLENNTPKNLKLPSNENSE